MRKIIIIIRKEIKGGIEKKDGKITLSEGYLMGTLLRREYEVVVEFYTSPTGNLPA